MLPMGLHRRAFVNRSLLGAISLSASIGSADRLTAQVGLAPSAASTRIGAQVYVFQQFHQRRNEQLAHHLPAMLEAHTQAGIRQLELMGDLLNSRSLGVLQEASRIQGIRYPIVYTGLNLYERAGRSNAIAQAQGLAHHAAKLGARFLNLNPQPKPQKARKSNDELAVEAEAIRAIARVVRGQGLTLLLHQHDAEMMDDARNWRYWLQHTDAADTRICFDTHWAHRAGQDVMALLRECRPRLESLHLRNSRQGVWWENLDDGDLNYRPLATHLRETNYQGYLMVELAWESATRLSRSLAENLRLSRHYTERRFLSPRT